MNTECSALVTRERGVRNANTPEKDDVKVN